MIMTRRVREIVAFHGLDPCPWALSGADLSPYLDQVPRRIRPFLPPSGGSGSTRRFKTIDWVAIALYAAAAIVVVVLVSIHSFVRPMNEASRELAFSIVALTTLTCSILQISAMNDFDPQLHMDAVELVGLRNLELRNSETNPNVVAMDLDDLIWYIPSMVAKIDVDANNDEPIVRLTLHVEKVQLHKQRATCERITVTDTDGTSINLGEKMFKTFLMPSLVL